MTVKTKQLPPGTELDNYIISDTISAGGFSIVYMATDKRNGQLVVIKEYLPTRLAYRGEDLKVHPIDKTCIASLNEGRKLFLLEVSALKKLTHPNIVHITDSFGAYETVYIVMEFKPGKNLHAYVSDQNGGFSEKMLRTLFPPLLDGLRVVHENNLLHLDIKPGNVHVQPGGNPILLDFGAVIRKNMSRTMQPRPVITPGFSPVEQHDPKGYCGPWTDIYAIGATIRCCIEGQPPPVATARKEKDTMKPAAVAFRKKYPASMLEAIDWAMEVDALLRPQTIDEFLEAFNKDMHTKKQEGGLKKFMKQLKLG